MPKSIFRTSLPWLLPLLALVAWQLVTSLELCPPSLLVPPLQLLATGLELIRAGELHANLLISLQRVLLGFSLGAGTALVLGFAIGLSRPLDLLFSPLLRAVYQVPLFAWMPLFIVLLGIEESSRVLFIAVGSFFPTLVNTCEGVRSLPKQYREVTESFETGWRQMIFGVTLPWAMPSILTGLRISFGLSWMLVVGAELFGSEDGVGFMMAWGRQMFQMDVVLVGVLVIGVVGGLINAGVGRIEKRLLRWRRAFDGATA